MDINCTLNCIYQDDGKCYLTDVSNISDIYFDEENAECPYMKKKSDRQKYDSRF